MKRGRSNAGYRTNKKRKIYRAKRRSRKSTIAKVPAGFPMGRRNTMRYVENITMSSSAGVMATHLFSANGIYDPDITGLGHQPYGYDQMAAYFNHYVVIGSKITVNWMNEPGSAVSENPSVVGVYLSDQTTVPYGNVNSFVEAKRGQFKNVQWMFMPTTTGRYSAKKFFNIKDVKDNVLRIGANNGTQPTDQAYYQVILQALGGSNASMTARVTIDYIVEWSEPRSLATS